MKQKGTCNIKYPVYSLHWQAKLPEHRSACQTAQTQKSFLRDASQMKRPSSNGFTIAAEFLLIGALFMLYNTAARELSAISLLSERSEEMSCN